MARRNVQMLIFLAFLMLLGLCAGDSKPLENQQPPVTTTGTAASASITTTTEKNRKVSRAILAPLYYNLPLDAATASQRINIVQTNEIAAAAPVVVPPTYVQQLPYVWPYYVAPHYIPAVQVVQQPQPTFVWSTPIFYY